MRNVICEHCREEVRVALYYYDERISINIICDIENYVATVKGKALCPKCGGEMVKTYNKILTPHTIIDLAIGRGE